MHSGDITEQNFYVLRLDGLKLLGVKKVTDIHGLIFGIQHHLPDRVKDKQEHTNFEYIKN